MPYLSEEFFFNTSFLSSNPSVAKTHYRLIHVINCISLMLNCSSTQFCLEIYYFLFTVKVAFGGRWYYSTWYIKTFLLTVAYCNYFYFLYYTGIPTRSSTLILYSWRLVISFLAHSVHLIKVCWMRTLTIIECLLSDSLISLSPLSPTYLPPLSLLWVKCSALTKIVWTSQK